LRISLLYREFLQLVVHKGCAIISRMKNDSLSLHRPNRGTVLGKEIVVGRLVFGRLRRRR
jgi:hypothetical protein